MAVEDAFGTVVWIVAAVGAIVALFTLVGSGRSYQELGGGGIVRDDDAVEGGDGAADPAAEREAEIRQMLQARNERRVRAGSQPLDVEQEIERRLRDLT